MYFTKRQHFHGIGICFEGPNFVILHCPNKGSSGIRALSASASLLLHWAPKTHFDGMNCHLD